MHAGKVIWIIGASQGIGRSLAKCLHRDGAYVILSARSVDSLRDLEAQLEDRCEVFPVDVTDLSTLKRAEERIYQRQGKLDSVVFMSAMYQPMKLTALDMPDVNEIIRVNLEGAFNLVDAIFTEMTRRKQGQIVLCGSVAGYRGLPGAQPYAATKAALINLAESLYLEAQGSGVDIKLINPGFVRTRLTDKNDFAMPAMIEPDRAAQLISKGMSSGRFEIHFPRRFTLILKMLQTLPYALYFWLVRRSRNRASTDQ